MTLSKTLRLLTILTLLTIFNIIEDIDIIDDFDITENINIIDDFDITENIDITDEIDITSSVFKRRRSDSHDEENCDYRDFDVAWKTDLKKHDNQIQSERETLLLLFSMMYVNWKICEIHNELLKITFNLNVYE